MEVTLKAGWTAGNQGRLWVSILVLMEVTLKAPILSCNPSLNIPVSILVLMEVTLKDEGLVHTHHPYSVSILVLMEVTLKESLCGEVSERKGVSILVLMEVTLKASATVVSCVAIQFQSLF